MEDSALKKPILILSSIIIIGTIGFNLIENGGLLDSFYWTIVTITTVGYGDIPITTTLGKVFAVFLIITGVGVILYTLTVLGENIVKGKVWELFIMKEKQSEIENLNNHLIVCGYGDVGQAISKHLIKHNEDVVVIDKDEEKLRTKATDIPYVVGDATKEEALRDAGISRSEALFSAVPRDSDNLLIVLNAKECNKDLKVIARSVSLETDKHIEKLGAEAVVHPDSEGGIRMAQSLLHPEVTELYNSLLEGDIGNAETIDVSQGNELIGKTIGESNLKENYDALIIALKRNNEIKLNPSIETEIKENDTLIIMAPTSKLKKIQKEL